MRNEYWIRSPRLVPRSVLAGLLGWLMTSTPGMARSVDGPPVPELPPPGSSAFRRPVVIGWPEGQTPKTLPGFDVSAFAADLQSPRWLYVLPNGDVLVAQARTERMGGLPPDVVAALTEQGVFGPSANTILLLRRTADGVEQHVFLEGLNQPSGMLLLGAHLYVANTDALLRFPYADGDLRIDAPAEKVVAMPAGEAANPWNNHWTRNLVAGPLGRKLYLTVGAATDVNADGNEPADRAAVWELDPDGAGRRLFATGLRNPVGIAFHPDTGELWVTVNERDGLGADVPPDYLTRVVDGAFYGWPWVYFGTYPDPTHATRNPARVAAARETARVPDLALGGHSVPLGLMFYRGTAFPSRFRDGAFIARRAGVGRPDFLGPDVIFVPFANGSPTGSIEPFLEGFVADQARGEVYGRAVCVAELPDGSILVSDDGASMIWHVRYTGR
jgi:glucose/arabinose dehydrogenase